jgi:hypothetical protein
MERDHAACLHAQINDRMDGEIPLLATLYQKKYIKNLKSQNNLYHS